jgi:hypothetical protein
MAIVMVLLHGFSPASSLVPYWDGLPLQLGRFGFEKVVH